MEKLNTWLLKQYVAAQAALQAEEGQGLVEYALIIVLVSIALVVALTALRGGIGNVFNNITTTLNG